MQQNNRINREWLKKARKAKNLSSYKVAELLDISRSHYSMIENGLATPSLQLAHRIATLLDFELGRFMEGEKRNSQQ